MVAIYGIAGTLVGIILGAILTRWIDFTYQRRNEVRGAIEAALIVRAELMDTRAGLNVVLEQEKSTGAFTFEGIGIWDSYRGRLLPSAISHAEWSEVNALFRHLSELKASLLDRPRDFDERGLSILRDAVHDCDASIEIVGTYAVEGEIPLLRPTKIFARK